jgi:hypothetical protein
LSRDAEECKTLAFGLAAVLWLIVERPMMNVESALQGGRRL